MVISKVGRRGQITLPRSVRHWLSIEEGDRIAFIRRGDEIVLQPVTRTLLDLRGSVPVTAPQDFNAIRQQVIENHARQIMTDEN
ncbi:MAG: AbrB/MazE/SpoVT family DNA-binding domain-containing protein [Anaerolineae bacterium]|nr:AbrB/MazE/SpoVT family DNA-binding domain-containing protein [Anaerolineae bacterium]